MKPKSQSQAPSPGYPNRREFLNTISRSAVGTGLWLGALRLIGSESEDQDPLGKLKKEVLTLSKKLGDEDFKVRRAATARLIAIGKGNGKDKALDKQAKEVVLSTMKSVADASRDPEIRERAKKVVVALTPKPKSESKPSPPGGIPVRPRGRIILR